jgi:hypothetical protein
MAFHDRSERAKAMAMAFERIHSEMNKGSFNNLLNVTIDYSVDVTIMPELDDYFEHNKTNLIRALILELKSDFCETLIIRFIEKLHRVGIHWPELDIIERSAKAELEKTKELSESFNNIDESAAPKLSGMQRLGIDRISQCIQTDNVDAALTIATNFRVTIKIMPEFGKFIEQKKHIIIKNLLSHISYQYYISTILGHIEGLHHIGIHWPELDIIKRSANAEKEQHNLNEADQSYLSRMRQSEINKVSRQIQDDNANGALSWAGNAGITIEIMPELGKFLELKKRTIIKTLLLHISDRYSSHFILGSIHRLHSIGIHWPELDTIERSAKAEKERHELNESTDIKPYNEHGPEAQKIIIKHLESCLGDTNEMPSAYYTDKALGLAYRYGITVEQFPKLGKALEYHKAIIIKYMLESLKAGFTNNSSYDLGYVLTRGNELRTVGINWEELNIIKRSINAIETQKLLKENNSPDDPVELSSLINDLAIALNYVKMNPDAQYRPLNFLGKLSRMIHFEEVTADEVAAELDSIKPKIIEHLLRNIKKHGFEYETEHDMHILRKIGVRWPELAIIERSAKWEKSKKQLREANNPAPLYGSEAMFERFNKLLDRAESDDIDIDVGEHLKKLKYSVIPRTTKIKILANKSTIFNALRVIMADTLIDTGLDIINWLKSNNINWPDLTLDNFKLVIIRSLLMHFKYESYYIVLQVIDRLRELRVHWVELNTIQQSVNAIINDNKKGTTLDEDDKLTSEDNSFCVSKIYKFLKDGAFFWAVKFMSHYKLTVNNCPELLPILTKFETNLKFFINGNHYELDALKSVRYLIIAGIDWPWLVNWIQNNKSIILKIILQNIKEDGWSMPNEMVTILSTLNLNWPELAIIRKSLDAMAYKPKLNETEGQSFIPTGPEIIKVKNNNKVAITNPAYRANAVYSGDPYEYTYKLHQTTFRRLAAIVERNGNKFEYAGVCKPPDAAETVVVVSPDLVWYRAPGNIHHRAATNIIYVNGVKFDTVKFLRLDNTAQDRILNEDIAFAIWYLASDPIDFAEKLRQMGIKGQDAIDKFNVVKQLIIDNINKDIHSYSFMIHAITKISKLKSVGVNWPELDEIIVAGKSAIIKDMLKRFKTDSHTDTIQRTLTHLKNLHVTWPELDIIQKSVDAERAMKSPSLNEGDILHDYVREALIDSINDAIDKSYKDDINAGFKLLTRLVHDAVTAHLTKNDLPELEKYFDERKHNVIKSILTCIKSGDDIYITKRIVNSLSSLGFNWPELPIIKKSLNALSTNPLAESATDIAPKKIPLGNGQFVRNPATYEKSTYSGDPDGFSFNITDSDKFRWLSSILKRNQKKLTYLGVGEHKARNSHHMYEDFVATGPDIVWCKILKNRTSHPINSIFVKGVEIMLYPFLQLPPEQQDIILDDNATKYDIISNKHQDLTNIVTNLQQAEASPEEVNEQLNKNKRHILKFILTKIKASNYSDSVDRLLKSLEVVDIDWPELKIIRRSVDADNSVKPVIAPFGHPQLNEDDFDTTFTIRNIKYYITQINAGAEKLQNIEMAIILAARNGITIESLPELFTGVNVCKENILHHVSTSFNKTEFKLGAFVYELIAYICGIGIKWPELISLLDKHKKVILTYILSHLKEGGGVLFIKPLINNLVSTGINWPELQIIQRSLDANDKRPKSLNEVADYELSDDDIFDKINKNLRDKGIYWSAKYVQYLQNKNIFKENPELYVDVISLIKDYNKSIKYEVDGQLNRKEYTDWLVSMIRFKNFGVEFDWLPEWLVKNKTKILRPILNDIKENILSAPRAAMAYLPQLGIDWPELVIIKKSLDALQTQI